MRNHSPLSRRDEVDPAPIDSLSLSPRRHRDNQLLPMRPMPVRPFAVPPPSGTKVLASPQCPKIASRRIASQHDIPSVAPIAAIRPTARNMRLPPEGHAPVPAGSPLNPDFRLVVHPLGA